MHQWLLEMSNERSNSINLWKFWSLLMDSNHKNHTILVEQNLEDVNCNCKINDKIGKVEMMINMWKKRGNRTSTLLGMESTLIPPNQVRVGKKKTHGLDPISPSNQRDCPDTRLRSRWGLRWYPRPFPVPRHPPVYIYIYIYKCLAQSLLPSRSLTLSIFRSLTFSLALSLTFALPLSQSHSLTIHRLICSHYHALEESLPHPHLQIGARMG